MEERMRSIYKEKNIDVPDTDLPIIQAQWEWLLSLKYQTKEMESGSYKITMNHNFRREK